MDSLITYDEVAEFLKNPPLLSPRPDFSKMRALRRHMVKALKQPSLNRKLSVLRGRDYVYLEVFHTKYLRTLSG
jgi:hypothetical protein